MKVLTKKRKEMIPQLEAAHISAVTRLREVFTEPETQAVLNRADSIVVELSERMATRAGFVAMRRSHTAAGFSSFSIKLNARLLAANPDQLIPTYLHELAHVIANLIFKENVGHDTRWQLIMRKLGLSSERCHSMDTAAFAKPQRRFLYACTKCPKTYKISTRKHTKYQHSIARGVVRFTCRCRGRLEHRP